MKQVVKYQTDDGQLFDTKAAAEYHENACKAITRLQEAIALSNLYFRDGSSGDDVAIWIYSNRNLILDCLKND